MVGSAGVAAGVPGRGIKVQRSTGSLLFRRESGHRMVISKRAVSKSWSVLQKENRDHWENFTIWACLLFGVLKPVSFALGGYLESLANSYKWSPSLSTGSEK